MDILTTVYPKGTDSVNVSRGRTGMVSIDIGSPRLVLNFTTETDARNLLARLLAAVAALPAEEPAVRYPCDGFATGVPCLDCPACDEAQGSVA